MKHSRVTTGLFAAVLRPLAVLSPLVGSAASLAGALPARGVEVPFTEHVISTAADGPSSVFATDVDGDGDTDVLSASYYDDKIAWYENDGGSPPTFTERVISSTADHAASVFATDVDGDGDTDVLSASSRDGWHCWNGALAADVNGDGTSSQLDVPALIDFLTGVGEHRAIWHTDIDRSGEANPADVLRVVQR